MQNQQSPSFTSRQYRTPFVGYNRNNYMGTSNYMDNLNHNSYYGQSNSNYINLNASNSDGYSPRYFLQQPPPSNQQAPLASNSMANSLSQATQQKSTNSLSSVTNTSSISNNSFHSSPDGNRLNVLKTVISRTLERLTLVSQQKKKLEEEERRLQNALNESRAEMERIEGRVRDPRLKNRNNANQNSSDSSNNSPAISTPSLTSNSVTLSTSSCSYPTTSYNTSSPGMDISSLQPSLGFLLTSTSSDSPSTVTSPVESSSTSLSSEQTSVLSSSLAPQKNFATSPHTSAYPNPTSLFINHNTVALINNSRSGVSSTTVINPPALFPPQLDTSVTISSGSLPATSSSPLFSSNLNTNPQTEASGENASNSVLTSLLVSNTKGAKVSYSHGSSREDILKPESYSEPRLKKTFTLKPSQVAAVITQPTDKRILLRICIIKTKKTSQSDRVPRRLQIKINGRSIIVGKNISGSIKAPLDITNYFVPDCGYNQLLEILWPENEPIKDYGVGVFFTQRLPVEQTLALLQTKDYLRPSSETKKLVRQNYVNTGDICSEDIMIPLTCPITKQRLEYPCIGTKCEHLCCFDAKSFINIYRARSEWHCPSCKKVIGYDDLRLDGLIKEILDQTPKECLKIRFDRNTDWKPIMDSRLDSSDCPTVIDDSKSKIDVITLDDSDDDRAGDSISNQPSKSLNLALTGKPRSLKEFHRYDPDEAYDDETDPAEEDDEDEEEEEEADDDDDGVEQDEPATKSDGEITNDSSDPDFEVRSNSSSSRSRSSRRDKLNDSTLDDEIQPPARSVQRKRKQLQDIFGSDPESNSPLVFHGRRKRSDRTCKSSKSRRK